MKVRKCDEQKEVESNPEDSRESDLSQCWRDPGLARRLLRTRNRVVGNQLKRVKNNLTEEMKFVSATSSRVKASMAWKEVRATRAEVWDSK